MNGHVFECYEEQGDRRQYTKTLEALESHVKKSCKFPRDLTPLFAEEMKEPTVVKPKALAPTADEVDKAIWGEEIKTYIKRSQELQNNFAIIHAVAWGQCSEAMRAKIKSHAKYTETTERNDCYWLLKQIKSVTLQFDETKYGFVSIMDARANFLNCRQGQGQTAADFIEQLRSWADAIEYHGGSVAESHELIAEMADDGTARTVEERMRMARDRTLGAAVIRGMDHTRYGTLGAELANQYTMGKDDYPEDMTSAYSMLVNYRTPANRPRGNTAPAQITTAVPPESSAMTFAQRGSTGGVDGVTHTGITCYNCQAIGHYASQCPQHAGTPTSTGTTLFQYGVMMAQSNAGGIDPSWILLDSQSTVSVFNNRNMLKNVRPSPHVLRAVTNGGFQDSNMIGEFPNLGDVWFNQESIANILSLSEVRKVCRVTMDTSAEAALLVHRANGSIMKFSEHPSGLYVFAPPTNNSSTFSTAYTLVSTVAEHKRMFSNRQIAAADLARALYRKIGRPDEAEFVSILQRNLIRNCPVTPDDAKRALLIYGPDIAVLKGKTTRTTAAPRAPTFVATDIPFTLLDHHRNVTVCIDLFFVQGLAFLHTISRGIGFRTVAPINDRTAATLLREIKAALQLYHLRGFIVRDIHCDSEFECLRDTLRPVTLNVVPPDSHVGDVERSIRTIKERLRSCVHGLPYKRLPKLLIQHMVADAVRCLNSFPRKNGISPTLSPAAIVTGVGLPDYACMRLELGAYVQVFEDYDPTNTPRARSLGAIALLPTGNAQGDYYFLSLASGARISRHNWAELPIPETAIARVEALGFADGQPLIQERGLVVEWRPDHPIDDYEYDANYVAPALAAADPDVLDAHLFDPVDPAEVTDLLDDAPIVFGPGPAAALPVPGAVNDHVDVNDNIVYADNAVDYDADDYNDEDDEYNDDPDPHNDDVDIADDDEDDRSNDEDDFQGAPGPDADQGAPGAEHPGEAPGPDADQGAPNHHHQGAPGAPASPYNLRPRTRTGPSQHFKHAMDSPHNGQSYFPPTQLLLHNSTPVSSPTGLLQNDQRSVFDFILAHLGTTCTQMSERAGLRKHGKVAEAALMTEFSQLENLDVYEALDPTKLTRQQKRAALRALNLFKEKRNGKLKSRTCADGRSQRNLYDKSQTASPTVSTDALMLSIIIDAFEARDVATADVVGAYLKAFMDDFVIMKFVGASVKILCQLNPKHIPFVTTENGVEVLYVRLIKALYGCVKSALLWYDLFTNNLKAMGFVLNPYDQCVANCIVDGKQCTIAWYVDDMKISHVDPTVVTRMIQQLEERFDKMTVTRGRDHVFLGMHIRYTNEKTAVITMQEYLEEALTESGLDISKTAATPASKSLFDVDDASERLGTREGEIFHSVAAKLLYVSLRARADLLLPIVFLCSRVSKSTRQDMAKLKRVLEYIKGTMNMEYIIGADELTKIRTWVDASYAVHPDMRSHTGGTMSLGRGGLLNKSTKHKLNTKSSTEAEFVGASDYLPNPIWVKIFLEAQGYTVTTNVFEQDNESAIKLEKNGRTSAGPKSRHIAIRYFWMKDRILSEGITLRHCPTLQMVADFFTKPLQGSLFWKFRAVIMGHEHMDTLALATPMPIEERVGETMQSRNSTAREHGSTRNSTTRAVATETSKTISWADVVKGVVHTNATKRMDSTNNGFREVILSKQSS